MITEDLFYFYYASHSGKRKNKTIILSRNEKWSSWSLAVTENVTQDARHQKKRNRSISSYTIIFSAFPFSTRRFSFDYLTNWGPTREVMR